MEIVVNTCYGGFSLSEEARMYILNNYGIECNYWGSPLERNDYRLIDCVKTLGGNASGGRFARLGLITIPDDVDWEIAEYDGCEYVVEKHRSWHYNLYEENK